MALLMSLNRDMILGILQDHSHRLSNDPDTLNSYVVQLFMAHKKLADIQLSAKRLSFI